MSKDIDVDALRSDDRNWKLGLFYTSRKDPAPLIPKRFGWGWTVNFGNPWIWLVGAIVLGAAIWGIVP